MFEKQKVGVWDAYFRQFYYGRIVKVCAQGAVIETPQDIRIYATFNRIFLPDMFGPIP